MSNLSKVDFDLSRVMAWMVVVISMGILDFRKLINLIEDSRCSLCQKAEYLLSQYKDRAAVKTEIRELILISPEDMGFEEAVLLIDFYERVMSIPDKPYSYCAMCVAVYLRLHHEHQEEGDRVYVGMEPVCDINEVPSILSLGRGGQWIWLDAQDATQKFSIETKFVFEQVFNSIG